MDAPGIVAWLATGLAVGLIAALVLQWRERADVLHDLVYTIPAGLLGTFMGSEAFKDAWRGVGSERGPEISGFFIVTGIVFGVFITFFAALAARAPAPGEERTS